MERQRKQLESSLKEVEYLFSCEEIIRSTGEFCSSLRKRGRAKLCFSSCTPLSVGATSDEGRMIGVDERTSGLANERIPDPSTSLIRDQKTVEVEAQDTIVISVKGDLETSS
ncbi:hypothetical protein BDFG_06133 [Blastomyces dermatitidis ATCC 26199]|nr:hypothetical protein BDFG_06133 [Blastomyces dermatitidis ATCC 26199]